MVSQNLKPIVIAGPTGVGKSTLALQIARDIGGEIICADSRQIYKHMSIGTACPSTEDYEAVPHHGFERLEPEETYSAGQFIEDADRYVSEIQSRGHTPILVGGTGLYLRAWRFGLDDVLPSDLNLRAELDIQELPALYEKLQVLDPFSAEEIKSTDSVRIKRALEIYALTGQKASSLRQTDWTRAPRVEARWILLTCSIQELDQRLKTRVLRMFELGLVEEALALRKHVSTPGYLEAHAYARSELSLEQAIEKTFRKHRQYAKRQVTWFKKELWWEKF